MGGGAMGPFLFISPVWRSIHACEKNLSLEILLGKVLSIMATKRNLRHILFMHDGATAHKTDKILYRAESSFRMSNQPESFSRLAAET